MAGAILSDAQASSDINSSLTCDGYSLCVFRSLSFVPPDGVFELMRYRAQYPNNAPFYVTPKISFHKDSGRLNIMVGMKAGGRDVPEKGIQDVKCTVHMPKVWRAVQLQDDVICDNDMKNMMICDKW